MFLTTESKYESWLCFHYQVNAWNLLSWRQISCRHSPYVGDAVVFLFLKETLKMEDFQFMCQFKNRSTEKCGAFPFFNVTTFNFQLVSLAGRSCIARDRKVSMLCPTSPLVLVSTIVMAGSSWDYDIKRCKPDWLWSLVTADKLNGFVHSFQTCCHLREAGATQ